MKHIDLGGTLTLPEASQRLHLPRNTPVFILSGSAASFGHASVNIEPKAYLLRDRVRILFSRVVAPACQLTGTTVITGGTNAGVMALLGEAMKSYAPDCVLLGIAPKALVPLGDEPKIRCDAADPEPHHTHLIRTEGQKWGDESERLVEAVEHLACRSRVVMVAIAGNNGTGREISLAIQHGWPLLLITGCGGAVDEIAGNLEPTRGYQRLRNLFTGMGLHPHIGDAPTQREQPQRLPNRTDCEQMRCVPCDAGTNIQHGSVAPCTADSQTFKYSDYEYELANAYRNNQIVIARIDDEETIRRALLWRLSCDGILRAAWTRFATMDRHASQAKPKDRHAKLSILALGIVATLAAILATFYRQGLEYTVLLTILIFAPLLSSLLLFLQSHHLRGVEWASLRTAAEAVRREIYRYRTRCKLLDIDTGMNPQERLAFALSVIYQHIDEITAALSDIEGRCQWPPRFASGVVSPSDSLLDPLSGTEYAEVRIRHQLAFYSARRHSAERIISWLLPFTFLATIAGTAVAVLGFRYRGEEIWVALVMSIGAAAFAWLDHDQTESRMKLMATGASAVRTAHERFLALPLAEQRKSTEIARLAEEVETALGAETAGWDRSIRQAERSFRG